MVYFSEKIFYPELFLTKKVRYKNDQIRFGRIGSPRSKKNELFIKKVRILITKTGLFYADCACFTMFKCIL